ncbi:MAG: S1C family serine protease, partial [Nitrospinaceae bacterium]
PRPLLRDHHMPQSCKHARRTLQWTGGGFLLLLMILSACSITERSSTPEKSLVPKTDPVFDPRFRNIPIADIDIANFWSEGLPAEVRDPIPLNNKTFSDLLAKVSAGVVNIYTLRIEERDVNFGLSPNDILPLRIPLLSQLIDIFPWQVPLPYRTEGFSLGSGFIINPEGYILTNAHVVANATEIRIVLAEGQTEIPAKIIGVDTMTDTALLKADPGFPLQPLPLGNSDEIQVGELVIAIGNPLGLTHTMTSGLVSAKQRIIPGSEEQVLDFLQTDSAINPGSSGGPLINMYGEVIGMNTAIISDAQLVGFAIPINTIKEVMLLLVTGETDRGWFGAGGVPLSPGDAVRLEYPKAAGILVLEVAPGSPAESSGLKTDDIIVEFNGQDMDDFLLFRRKLLGLTPGNEISLKVFRKGETLDMKAKLIKNPEAE